jgi:DNA-directed RNA polymerase subunit RPC12/RpoP
MDIETCESCNKKFELITNYMGGTVCTEVEEYYCPYCGHKHRKSVRGTFRTKPLPEAEQ